ncbi:redoxin domain-containing protein [Leucothrix pacifica]|uniref:Protein disulfide oxidoreductase n=1 Tax=Leucothrix pacifica TaxID=1247513 RepID=A0A317C454_9GAMM|nr:redoxin domain-containing protein [Leucothrix pacifica]PWQ93059.1 protein disulfide oxidoreductase [Leucothrix pacifica]
MSGSVRKKRKRSWLRLFTELLVIVGIVFAARFWMQRDLPSGQAPNFQAVLMDGKVVNLEDYRGEPVLLHFWASWCKFCKMTEGSITGVQKDWNVLSVAFKSGDKKEVAEYIKERDLDSWNVIPDSDGRLAELFGVQAVPASYIIDGKGAIRVKEVGLTTGWGLRVRLWYAKNVSSLSALVGLKSAEAASGG